MATETDAEKKKRKLKESSDKKQARRAARDMKQDWRLTADPDTRMDTDFMTEIYDDKNKPKLWTTNSFDKKGNFPVEEDTLRLLP